MKDMKDSGGGPEKVDADAQCGLLGWTVNGRWISASGWFQWNDLCACHLPRPHAI